MAGVAEGWSAQSELDLEELVVEVLSAEMKADPGDLARREPRRFR